MAKLVTWSQYRESIGDRSSLFAALAEAWPIERALYPGSYVDLSPSTAFPSVVFVDSDPRAGRFFADPDLVAAEVAGRTRPGAGSEVRFLGADYTHRLDLAVGSVDLLISLFAGPVWQHCARYLRPGGWLLANTSHGDASLAALDPKVRLAAVVHHRDDRYRLTTDAPDQPLTGSTGTWSRSAWATPTPRRSEPAAAGSPTRAPPSRTCSSASDRHRSERAPHQPRAGRA